MTRFTKKLLSAALTAALVLSAIIAAPASARADEKVITIADLDKSLFTDIIGDNGYKLTYLAGNLTIKSGETLKIGAKQAINLGGTLTVKNGGRVEVAYGSNGFSIYGFGGWLRNCSKIT